MNIGIRALALAAGLSGLAAAAHAASGPAIILDPARPGDDLVEVWARAGTLPDRIRIALPFGDEYGGRVLTVLPEDGDASRYRVSVQFETSMGLSGEGPHIDLLDWKHCRTDWRMAEPADADGFRLPTPRDEDHECFPHATKAELRAAVEQALRAHGWDEATNKGWLQQVGQVPRVGELPSYAAISTVRVRIEQYDGRQWRVLTTIEFDVPMGC